MFTKWKMESFYCWLLPACIPNRTKPSASIPMRAHPYVSPSSQTYRIFPVCGGGYSGYLSAFIGLVICSYFLSMDHYSALQGEEGHISQAHLRCLVESHDQGCVFRWSSGMQGFARNPYLNYFYINAISLKQMVSGPTHRSKFSRFGCVIFGVWRMVRMYLFCRGFGSAAIKRNSSPSSNVQIYM